MRAQERQLAWVRLGMVALAAAVLLIVAPTMPGIEILFAVLGVVAAWSVLVFWLLRRFPAREVGIISTVVEMAAVTIAVYVAVDAPDLYLLYGLVILGAALHQPRQHDQQAPQALLRTALGARHQPAT